MLISYYKAADGATLLLCILYHGTLQVLQRFSKLHDLIECAEIATLYSLFNGGCVERGNINRIANVVELNSAFHECNADDHNCCMQLL